jgi:hypothetical protein
MVFSWLPGISAGLSHSLDAGVFRNSTRSGWQFMEVGPKCINW